MSQSHLIPVGQAPVDATYITQTANANLTNEQALSSLATGYMKSTTGTGVVTTQATPIPIADGGTNNTSYTTNGVVYKDATKLTNTAAGTTGTVLHGNTGAAPTFSAVSLTADVTGTLPVANGGTGQTSFTNHGVILGAASAALGVTAAGSNNRVLKGNTGADPSFGQVDLTADVTGLLPINAGGTGVSTTFTAGSVIFAGSSTTLAQDNSNLFWNDSANELYIGGTSAATANIRVSADGSAVFNEQGSGTAADFRIEGDTATNLFVVDYSADSVEIGTTVQGRIAKFNSTNIIFNEDAQNLDFRVEGQTQANLLFTDASADQVGIRTNAPAATLHINGGLALGTTTVASGGTLTLTGDHFCVNSAPLITVTTTITLPSAATAGRMYLIKKTNGAALGTLRITPAGADTIDGVAGNLDMVGAQASRTLLSNGGTNWMVVASV